MSLMITKILVFPVSRCSTRVDRVRRLVWDNDGDGLELERCFLARLWTCLVKGDVHRAFPC